MTLTDKIAQYYVTLSTIGWWNSNFPHHFLTKFKFWIGDFIICITIIRLLSLSEHVLIKVKGSKNVPGNKQDKLKNVPGRWLLFSFCSPILVSLFGRFLARQPMVILYNAWIIIAPQGHSLELFKKGYRVKIQLVVRLE